MLNIFSTIPKISEENVFLRLSTSTSRILEDEGVITESFTSVPIVQKKAQEERLVGSFSWPSGAHYRGEFSNGRRNGRGIQTWQDGSHYEGDFVNDMRHGKGVHHWNSGQVYEGSFYKDHRHGYGCYTWPNGTKYTGTFYLDKKEGYGSFEFANGDKFEGLYRENERFGPGVMTYKNENFGQEVGIWHREKLLKFCYPARYKFTMKDHSEYLYYPEEHRSSVHLCLDTESDMHKIFVKESNSYTFLSKEFRSSLFSENSALPPGIETYSSNFEFLPLTHKHKEEIDKAFFGNDYDVVMNDSSAVLVAINNTSLMMEMQKHVLKHHHDSDSVSFSIETIMSANRDAYPSKSGSLEVMSQSLIEMAAEGNMRIVYSILKSGLVDPNVSDSNGNCALIGAAANCHHDIVNLLLDMGANVNQLNDEGVCALTACHIFYYPTDHFKWNHPEVSIQQYRALAGDFESKADLRQRRLSQPSTIKLAQKMSSTSKFSVKSRTRERRSSITGPGGLHGKQPSGSSRVNLYNRSLDSHPLAVREELARKTESEYRPLKGRLQSRSVGRRSSISGRSGRRLSGASRANLLSSLDPPSPTPEEIEKKKIDTCKSDVRIMKAHREALSEKSLPLLNLQVQRKKHKEKGQPLVLGINEGTVTGDGGTDKPSFDSNQNLVEFEIGVTDDLIIQTANLLSLNKRAVSGVSTRTGEAIDYGTPTALAAWKAEHANLRSMINLLLQRGANPNASTVPFPVLFFAVKAGDVEGVESLLNKGAATDYRLSDRLFGFTVLHLACGITCPEGVKIVALLLNAGADPNIAAFDEDVPCMVGKTGSDADERSQEMSFTNSAILPFPSQSTSTQLSHWLTQGPKQVEETGRTPLHVACDRDDDHKCARNIVRLLMLHGANPDVNWGGHSPLTLAVASGNDMCIDELLEDGANPSLQLTRGVGSALCAAANPKYERRRSPEDRIALVNKLIEYDANILAPVSFGTKQLTGTVVDYAHWMFSADKRIAHTPYHALSVEERETYAARKQLLAHIGTLLRDAAVKVESDRLKEEFKDGVKSVSPSRSARFLYTGAGAVPEKASWEQELNLRASCAPLGPAHSAPERIRSRGSSPEVQSPLAAQLQTSSTIYRQATHSVPYISHVSFVQPKENITAEDGVNSALKENERKIDESSNKKKPTKRGPIRKPLFRYCYDCGRSVGVRLSPCTRCFEVYYCSRACKLKAWEERHKDECLRLKVSRDQSPMPPEVAALFVEGRLSDTMERAQTKTRSVVDSVLHQQLLVAEENALLAARRQAYGLRQTRVGTAKSSAKPRAFDSSASSRRVLSSRKSAKVSESSRKRHSGRQNTAKVGHKTRQKVGKDVVFGTTGMTLAELGITENYSFE